MTRLSASKEDYLKAIHSLDPCGAGVRVTDIAEALSVTKASVSRAVTGLEEQGLAERFGKHRIGLTEEGRKYARLVKSRYETIRLYMVEVLHIHSKIAAKEACKLEHVLDDTSLHAMQLQLDESTDWKELAELAYA